MVGIIRQYSDDRYWAGEESLNLLNLLPSTSLSGLDLVLDGTSRRIADSVPSRLSVFDKLLATSERFPTLKEVHLRVGRSCDSETRIRKDFAHCQRKGLVTVSTSMFVGLRCFVL